MALGYAQHCMSLYLNRVSVISQKNSEKLLHNQAKKVNKALTVLQSLSSVDLICWINNPNINATYSCSVNVVILASANKQFRDT